MKKEEETGDFACPFCNERHPSGHKYCAKKGILLSFTCYCRLGISHPIHLMDSPYCPHCKTNHLHEAILGLYKGAGDSNNAHASTLIHPEASGGSGDIGTAMETTFPTEADSSPTTSIGIAQPEEMETNGSPPSNKTTVESEMTIKTTVESETEEWTDGMVSPADSVNSEWTHVQETDCRSSSPSPTPDNSEVFSAMPGTPSTDAPDEDIAQIVGELIKSLTIKAETGEESGKKEKAAVSSATQGPETTSDTSQPHNTDKADLGQSLFGSSKCEARGEEKERADVSDNPNPSQSLNSAIGIGRQTPPSQEQTSQPKSYAQATNPETQPSPATNQHAGTSGKTQEKQKKLKMTFLVTVAEVPDDAACLLLNIGLPGQRNWHNFPCEKLSSWTQGEIPLTLYKTELRVPAAYFSRDSVGQYKYAWLIGKGGKLDWEKLPYELRNKSSSGVDINRLLPLDVPEYEEYTHVDGFAYFEIKKEKNKSWLAWAKKKLYGIIKDDLKFPLACSTASLELFLPRPTSSGFIDGSAFLAAHSHLSQHLDISQAYQSLRRSCSSLFRSQAQTIEDFAFKEHLQEALVNKMEEMADVLECEENWEVRITGSLVYVCVLRDFDRHQRDVRYWKKDTSLLTSRFLGLLRLPEHMDALDFENLEASLAILNTHPSFDDANKRAEMRDGFGGMEEVLATALRHSKIRLDLEGFQILLSALNLYQCTLPDAAFTDPNHSFFWLHPFSNSIERSELFLQLVQSRVNDGSLNEMQRAGYYTIVRSLLHLSCSNVQDIRKTGLHRLDPAATLVFLSQLSSNIPKGKKKEVASELEILMEELLPLNNLFRFKKSLEVVKKLLRGVYELTQHDFRQPKSAPVMADSKLLSQATRLVDLFLAWTPEEERHAAAYDLHTAFCSLLESWGKMGVCKDEKTTLLSVWLTHASFHWSTDNGLASTWLRFFAERFRTLLILPANSSFDETLGVIRTVESKLPSISYPDLRSKVEDFLARCITRILNLTEDETQRDKVMGVLGQGEVGVCLSSIVRNGLHDSPDLLHFLNWPLLQPILSLGEELLDESAKQCLEHGKTLANAGTKAVADNAVCVADAQLIFEKRSILEMMCEMPGSFYRAVSLILGHRQTLMGRLELLDLCFPSESGIHVPGLDTLRRIDEAGTAGPLSDIGSLVLEEGKWVPFLEDHGASPAALAQLGRLERLQGLALFDKEWSTVIKDVASTPDHPQTLEALLEETLGGVEPKLSRVLVSILEGEISCNSFNQLLQSFSDGYLDNQFVQECADIVNVCGIQSNHSSIHTALEDRKGQLEVYMKMKQSRQTVEELNELARCQLFEPSLDLFHHLTTMLTQTSDVSGQTKLKDVVGQEEEAALSPLEPEVLVALSTFRQSKALFDWLRKYVVGDDGLARCVDRWVDLVMSNVGEDEEKLKLLSDLSVVANVYSPLFNSGVFASLKSLDEALSKLWEALVKQPGAPEMLKRVVEGMETLEVLNDEAVNVEAAEVARLEKICASGLFHLHAAKHKSGKMTEAGILSLSYIVSGSGSEEKKEELSLDELKEIHSNAILINAQMLEESNTKATIKHFSKVFDAVQRFSSLFIRHWEAGDLFFAGLEGWFYLDRHRTIKICIRPYPKASELTSTDDLVSELGALCDVLQDTEMLWKDFIRLQRHDYPALNYFTNRQLLFLRHHLALVATGVNTNLDLELHMILMALRKTVTIDDVKRALQTGEKEKTEEDVMAEMTGDEAEAVLKRQTVSELTDFGHSAKKAWEAVKENGTSLEECLHWLEDNAKEITVPDVVEAIPQSIQLHLENPNASLSETLNGAFRDCLNEQTTDEVRDEHMGLQRLGQTLTFLQHHGPSPIEGSPQKPTPPIWLKANTPNLIVVPEVDQLRYLLSLSKDTNGNELDLFNVLFCSDVTTEEELSLFVLRMRQSSKAGLYAILSIHHLDSKLSTHLEAKLNELAVDSDLQDFFVALFCSSERYETSHMAGLMAKFRRPSADKKWAMKKKECRDFVCALLKDKHNEAGDLTTAMSDNKAILVTSVGYGQGKSLAIRRLDHASSLRDKIVVHQRSLPRSQLWAQLKEHVVTTPKAFRCIHIDITDHRTKGVDRFLFELLILGGFSTSDGKIWRWRPSEKYVVEMTSSANSLLALREPRDDGMDIPVPTGLRSATQFRFCLPLVQCHGPQATLHLHHGGAVTNQALLHRHLDDEFMDSPPVRRCIHYIHQYRNRVCEPAPFDEQEETATELGDRLEMLLSELGVETASWLELNHFVLFLNRQLEAVEENSFCVSGELRGFKNLVIFFSLEMARDFATRSLHISEEVAQLESDKENLLGQLEQYSVKHQWEQIPHPYLFFNPDLHTFSFFGCHFTVNGRSVNLVDPKTKDVLPHGANIMDSGLLNMLEAQLAPFGRGQRGGGAVSELRQPFETLSREEKLRKLYSVLIPEADYFLGSLDYIPDPNPNYELTTDCVLKMLAMEMRIRCGIPIVVMGETGCGKTKLIEYFASLKSIKATRLHPDARIQNFCILRVHGGTDADRIAKEVKDAKVLSETNWEDYQLDTILFMDEANTTPAVSLVKEVLVERSVSGVKIKAEHLRFAAALNPYRKHSDEAIAKLENAGLGYHVQDLELLHRFDDTDVPLRQLVYRVNPLPPSLVPLVWDFGFLSCEAEALYIAQMIRRFCLNLADVSAEEEAVITSVICAAQKFMKEQKDETSFVSLRDVERALKVFHWFLLKSDVFFTADLADNRRLSNALVLALAVSYRASLSLNRCAFDQHIAGQFRAPVELDGDWSRIQMLVDEVSSRLIKGARMNGLVARNEALRENVFLMTVTAQLGIPLFLIGKPGSSKSLGKAIVADNMKGRNSDNELFRGLKEVQMISYQCSPLATAEGVASVFRKCADLQRNKEKDLADYAAVPIFDEIGLAEDSPRLPLKALHGLLEDGTAGLDGVQVEPWHRTGFIGISNWALDPAKMNRGIFVSRSLPDEQQLIQTAESICDKSRKEYQLIKEYIPALTRAYLQLYKEQEKDYEFFGLRDFYQMMKELAELAEAKAAPLQCAQHGI